MFIDFLLLLTYLFDCWYFAQLSSVLKTGHWQFHHQMPSHRTATYRADVVNRALISRDDVKRELGQVQTINCIEVSDSNE